MSDLTFVGLASYSNGINNLINVIFSSNQTTTNAVYYSQVTNSATVPTPPTLGNLGAWSVIPNIPANIPANTEISAQLTSTVTPNFAYYVYIVSSVTNTIIWQTYTPVAYTTTNNFTSVIDYTTQAPVTVITNGGYILSGQPNVITRIQSNVIYTRVDLTINIPAPPISPANVLTTPLFIMSQGKVIISGGTLNTTGGSINVVGSAINDAINITGALTTSGNVTLNGTVTAIGGYGITIAAGVTNSGTGTLTLNGTATAVGGIGIYIGAGAVVTNSSTGTLTLNGTANDVGGVGIYIGAAVTNSGTGTLTLNGTVAAAGGIGNGIDINGVVTNSSTGTLTLNGTATNGEGGDGIFIRAAVTNSNTGTLTLNGTAPNGNGTGIFINADVIFTGTIFFNLAIVNSIVIGNIFNNFKTITNTFNVGINPISNLTAGTTYPYVIQHVPSANIANFSGTFNNIIWNLIQTTTNNWILVTYTSSNIINLNSENNNYISGNYVVIYNSTTNTCTIYTIPTCPNSPIQLIKYGSAIGKISGMVQTNSILVTCSQFGTITYISYGNSEIIATGLYGINSITIDNFEKIFYVILSLPNIYNVYILGYNEPLITGNGQNIQLFCYNGNLITVNTDTNIINTYMLVETLYPLEIKLTADLKYTLNVTKLGNIINIVNNKGDLIFLFNNNMIYKLVNNIMKLILITTPNYSSIAIANNSLYGINYDGVNLTATILYNIYTL